MIRNAFSERVILTNFLKKGIHERYSDSELYEL